MTVVNRCDIKTMAETLKSADKTIVFTNGCFDILHAGHVRYLNEAKKIGDCLIVGLNSDESVRKLKGPSRPINSEEDRAEVLSALSAVDYVVVFSDATAEGLVTELQPAIYVKGGDYNIKNLPEAEIVAQYGGKTILIPEVVGKSSSNIINKMKQ